MRRNFLLEIEALQRQPVHILSICIRETRRGVMENGSASDTPATKALAMLSAFASVGARAFNLTLTNIDGEKTPGGYRPNTPLEQLRRTIGRVLEDAEKSRHNVIIRPRSSTATLIQLDDLDFARAERIAPHSVIVFRTSPGQLSGVGCRREGRAGRFRPPTSQRHRSRRDRQRIDTHRRKPEFQGEVWPRPGYCRCYRRQLLSHD